MTWEVPGGKRLQQVTGSWPRAGRPTQNRFPWLLPFPRIRRADLSFRAARHSADDDDGIRGARYRTFGTKMTRFATFVGGVQDDLWGLNTAK